ncbi:alpha-1B adrenergic receptor [Hydra vulgaris]|uniref:Alpha-1B adrenergic receptor n=1 Tax=Hydra vulgaris TaxID=6087 RepID=A0ABM4C6S2_HYDVU
MPMFLENCQFNISNDTHFLVPSKFIYITGIYSIVLSVIAFIENGLVILAYFKDPTGKLQTPLNYFLINLCFSDLMISCISLPVFAYDRMFQTTLPNILHTTVDVSFFLTVTASMLNMLVLVIDRFAAIQWPFLYRVNINIIRSRFVTMGVWLVAILISIGSLFCNLSRYYFVMSNLHTFVILISLCVSFIAALRKLQKQEGTFLLPEKSKNAYSPLRSSIIFQRDHFPHRFEEYNRQSLQLPNRQDSRRPRSDSIAVAFVERNDRVRRSYTLQLIVFTTLLLPSCALSYFLMMSNSCSYALKQTLHNVHMLLTMTTCAVNPYLLALRLDCFQKSIRIIFIKQDVERSDASPGSKITSDVFLISFSQFSRRSSDKTNQE